MLGAESPSVASSSKEYKLILLALRGHNAQKSLDDSQGEVCKNIDLL